jgi:hypothetical protein
VFSLCYAQDKEPIQDGAHLPARNAFTDCVADAAAREINHRLQGSTVRSTVPTNL